MKGSYSIGLGDALTGLNLLGVHVNPHPTRREADAMFEQVKNEILAVGFEEILSIPKARDAKTDLAIALLNDASTNAYWSTGEGFADVIGLTVSTARLCYPYLFPRANVLSIDHSAGLAVSGILMIMFTRHDESFSYHTVLVFALGPRSVSSGHCQVRFHSHPSKTFTPLIPQKPLLRSENSTVSPPIWASWHFV